MLARRVVDWDVAVAVSHDLMFITGESHCISIQSLMHCQQRNVCRTAGLAT